MARKVLSILNQQGLFHYTSFKPKVPNPSIEEIQRNKQEIAFVKECIRKILLIENPDFVFVSLASKFHIYLAEAALNTRIPYVVFCHSNFPQFSNNKVPPTLQRSFNHKKFLLKRATTVINKNLSGTQITDFIVPTKVLPLVASTLKHPNHLKDAYPRSKNYIKAQLGTNKTIIKNSEIICYNKPAFRMAVKTELMYGLFHTVPNSLANFLFFDTNLYLEKEDPLLTKNSKQLEIPF